MIPDIYMHMRHPNQRTVCFSEEIEALGTRWEAAVSKELCKSPATGGERLRLAQFDWEV